MKKSFLFTTAIGTLALGGIGVATVLGASAFAADKGETMIPAEKALQLALEKTEGFIQEVELTFEEDENLYEIEIESDIREYEFNIDALDGAFTEEEEDQRPSGSDYPNKPSGVEDYPEYMKIAETVKLDGLDFHLSTDNQGNRIMFLVDGNGEKRFKTVFIKYSKQLEIIDLKDGGLIYRGTI